jgi:hypothetical protein
LAQLLRFLTSESLVTEISDVPGGSWIMGIGDYLSKRQKLTISLGSLGLVLAVVLWGYSELVESAGPLAGFVTVVLCPPSLLSIPLIDVGVGTSDYRIMSTVFTFMNAALYAAIGSLIGKSRWQPDE